MMTVEALVFFTLGRTQRHSSAASQSQCHSNWDHVKPCENERPIMLAVLLQEKPDVTYNDVGGAKEQLERLREACLKF